MIKKGSLVFLLLFALFFSFVAGMFMGRQNPSANINLTSQTLQTNSDNDFSEKTASGKVNINTASYSLLLSLPNIGETLAQRIIDYRTEYGAYSCIDDLLNVKGIGEAKLADIRPYITAGG